MEIPEYNTKIVNVTCFGFLKNFESIKPHEQSILRI